MFFFFSIIKLGVLLLFFLVFSNFTEMILRFSLLNVVYFSIQAVIGKYFPSMDSKQTSLLGFGVSCILSCFIPSMALEVFSIFVSTAGILYRVTESAQLLTVIFQFSRNLKERMPNAPAFWGGLILLLTLVNIILAFCYDYSFYGAVKESTTTEDLSLIKTLLFALVVLQIMAIAFTIIKANYDSIILNSATFALYLSLLAFQILSKKNMFSSSCSFKDRSVIGGLLNIALFERDKGFWGVTKDCLDTSFVLNLVVPALVYYTLPATFPEWKLFWTGKREDEEREEAKQNGFVSKLVSIAFLLFGTDMLIKGDRSIPECCINLVIGSLFFVLKIFVADIYSPTKKS